MMSGVALAIAIVLLGVQQAMLVVELYILRRDLRVLLRVTTQLNHAVNPWGTEDEPTKPDAVPHTTSRWNWLARLRRKYKRQQPRS